MIKGHDPLYDTEIAQAVNQSLSTVSWNQLSAMHHSDVIQAWRSWMADSPYCKILGLDDFKFASFCAGTTPVFGEFVSRHNQRRIRVSRSDFILTSILARTYARNICYLEDQELHANDCVILSQPYSGNGTQHPDFEQLLTCADQLGVPVMIDGAYFGLAYNNVIDLQHPCITDFATSFTKNFFGHSLRVGMRFTRELVDDTISAGILAWEMYDRVGAHVATDLMSKFSHAWFIEKYQPLSKQICQDFDLTPTATITLALGGEQYNQFRRGDYNRVCITDELIRLSSHS